MLRYHVKTYFVNFDLHSVSVTPKLLDLQLESREGSVECTTGSPISALFISSHKHELPYRGEPQTGETEVSLV
jgi:hypothetical protein